MDKLEASGILDHSYLVVTSDHGELFERGENGHNTFLLYDSVIHIPLLVSAPQQTKRQDFYSLTSNIDVLPTLLNIVKKEIPSSVEGRLLPGFGGAEDATRSIFAGGPAIASLLKEELLDTLSMVNKPFEKAKNH